MLHEEIPLTSIHRSIQEDLCISLLELIQIVEHNQNDPQKAVASAFIEETMAELQDRFLDIQEDLTELMKQQDEFSNPSKAEVEASLGEFNQWPEALSFRPLDAFLLAHVTEELSCFIKRHFADALQNELDLNSIAI